MLPLPKKFSKLPTWVFGSQIWQKCAVQEAHHSPVPVVVIILGYWSACRFALSDDQYDQRRTERSSAAENRGTEMLKIQKIFLFVDHSFSLFTKKYFSFSTFIDRYYIV